MVIGMAEFLEKAGNLKRTQEKIDALRANDSLVLRCVLQAAYDPNVNFALPPGNPPYSPNKLPDQEHIFIREAPKAFRYFLADFYPNMKQTKREQMFIEFLESVGAKDAELVLQIKEKKYIKGFTPQCVNEAFPDLIPNNKA